MNRIACAPLLIFLAGIVSAQQTLPETEVRIALLIDQLHTHPWQGAQNLCIPICWMFHFTEPMKQILETGAAAQQPLLQRLSDPEIEAQVIILLGGVGDERSIGPIINAMKLASSGPLVDWRRKITAAGNIALTNITVADVIWHHGGGITVDACPDDPSGCWARWRQKNQASFHVKGVRQSRNYSNYPNYGIYRGLS